MFMGIVSISNTATQRLKTILCATSIHTIGYYLAMKRNEGLLHATTWINLEMAS